MIEDAGESLSAGDREQAWRLLDQAGKIIRLLPSRRQRAGTLALLAWLLKAAGRGEESDAAAQESLDLAEGNSGLLEAVARPLVWRGDGEAVEAAARRLEHPQDTATVLLEAATAPAVELAGKWELALPVWRMSLAYAEQAGRSDLLQAVSRGAPLLRQIDGGRTLAAVARVLADADAWL